jgi:hypothetical protein
VLLTVGLAGYAFHQRQAATIARDEAESRMVAVEDGQPAMRAAVPLTRPGQAARANSVA